ncbi:MAG TPA: ribonuclease E inhibitor RraB [Hyphomonadaceae bacterium]|jgi:hypothetical protein|nr:ribonuclease E inhibitor RraB [Hyphomonadaceae bacterium]
MFGFGKKKSPPPRELNDAVRKLLAEHGDNGSAARHVVHYVYPSKKDKPSPRSQVKAELEALGFKVRNAAMDGGLIFEHHVPVAEDGFDELTEQLEEWLDGMSWGNDGWEAALSAGEPK